MTEQRKAYLKEYSHKYYLANKEWLIVKGVEWSRQNQEKRTAITAKYRRKHRQEIAQYNQEHKNEQRKRNVWANCRITLEEYNHLFSAQSGLCLGCKKHQAEFKLAFAVDHDHQTGKIRGLLCGQCNTALGLVKDNIETLIRLSEYVRANRFAYIPTIR